MNGRYYRKAKSDDYIIRALRSSGYIHPDGIDERNFGYYWRVEIPMTIKLYLSDERDGYPVRTSQITSNR